jgi:beta-glucanase (GH16 family)
MQFARIIHNTILSVLLLLIISCGNDEEIIKEGYPLNLIIETNVTNDGSGLVTIQASAENATEYQFRIGSSNEPVETNSTGFFEYSFVQSGNYTLDIRAFGSSGMYLREEIQVSVVVGSDAVSVEDGYFTPLSYDGYTLVWNDEFDGTQINESNWVFETGTGCPNLCGWGNNELQYYRRENAWVENGVLTIEARNENFLSSNYTSARMKTQGKRSFQYGRIDIRALLPKGQGIWPALWMLGNNITTASWPASGEIDIMEMIGGQGRENRVHGTLHWEFNGHASAGGTYTLTSGTFADEYHVFSITWDESEIKWFVNDIRFHTINITPSHMTEFHQEFFFIFNIAVGGNWPGSPDATTIFPQQMKVDYIRVFQKSK